MINILHHHVYGDSPISPYCCFIVNLELVVAKWGRVIYILRFAVSLSQIHDIHGHVCHVTICTELGSSLTKSMVTPPNPCKCYAMYTSSVDTLMESHVSLVGLSLDFDVNIILATQHLVSLDVFIDAHCSSKMHCESHQIVLGAHML